MTFKQFAVGLLLLTTPLLAFDSIQLKQTITAPKTLKNFTPGSLVVQEDGRLWVIDHNRMLGFSAAGELEHEITTGSSGPFGNIEALARDHQGRLYLSDSGSNHRSPRSHRLKRHKPLPLQERRNHHKRRGGKQRG